MHRITTLARSLIVACIALIGTGASAAEYVIWYSTTKGLESAWIATNTTGNGYRVLATRPGRTISDGTRLWSLEPMTRSIPTADCPEGDAPESTAATPGKAPTRVYGLAALPVLGGEGTMIVALDQRRLIVGSLNETAPAVLGSVGAVVSYARSANSYSCGAHPDAESSSGTTSPSTQPTGGVFDGLRLPEHDLAAATRRLKRKLDAQCVAAADDLTIDADRFGVELFKGRVEVVFDWSLSTDIHAIKACELSEHVRLDIKRVPDFQQPNAAVQRALRERGSDGPIGWAALTLSGADHDRALAHFQPK